MARELHSGRRSIDVVGRRWLWYAVSAVLVLLAVAALSVRGLDLGTDFTRGSEIRVALPADQVDQETVDAVARGVADTGIANASSPEVTTAGDEAILVSTQQLDDAESDEVVAAVVSATDASPQDVSRTETGPTVDRQTVERVLLGLALLLVLAVLLVWAYFREWKVALVALAALAQTLLLTLGVHALSGFEVSLATVTGVLAVAAFSLHNSVVVLDRVRDNTHHLAESRTSHASATNLAANQTLVRSANTALVVLVPAGAILAVSAVRSGPGSLVDLALPLFVGTAAAVYSTHFLATPLLVHLKQGERGVKEADRRAAVRQRQSATPPTERRTPAPAASDKRGPTAPRPRGTVAPSAAAGRPQPTRKPKSKAKSKPKPRPGSGSKSKRGRR